MEATTDDNGTVPPAGQLTPEHVAMEDISARLVEIQSVQQTIREQIRALEDNGIETSVHELKGLLPELDGIQTSLRKSFAAHAHTANRKTRVLSLPTELLVMIFEDVRGNIDLTNIQHPIHDIQAIQHSRLVCRVFCNASSHLLLPNLNVTLATSSLEHLDEVSRHPTISKGVREISILAALYDRVPAKSLRDFTDHFVKMLRQMRNYDSHSVRHLLGLSTSAQSSENSNHVPPQSPDRVSSLVEKLLKRNKILISCTEYLQSEVLQPDKDENMATLCQLYREYSQLLNDQKELLECGTFVTRVAGAVARMPTVTGLSITDLDYKLRPVLPETSCPIYGDFRQRLLKLCVWEPEQVSLLPQGPVKLLHQLPLAFVQAGNPLARFSINLGRDNEHSLKLSEDEVKNLVGAAKDLNVLEIDYQLPVRAFRSKKLNTWRAISKIAHPFSTSTKLRSLALDCSFWASELDGSECPSFQPLLVLFPWAHLNKVSLGSIVIHYRELKEHIDKLALGTNIALREVYLLSGRWADLLDVIRGKADDNSAVTRLTGKEDDESGQPFPKIFHDWEDEENPGSAYISGETSENPLRLPEIPEITG